MPKAGRSLQSILNEFPVFKETDQGKLLCTLTKHELSIAEIEKYVTTKKFLDRWDTHDVLSKYGEHFQELGKGIVACLLTKRSVARNGISLRNHVKTPRFLAALFKAKEDKAAKEAEEKAAAEKEAAEAQEAASNADDMNEKMDVTVENDDEEEENKASPYENAAPSEQSDDEEEISEEDEPPKPAQKRQKLATKKNRRLPKSRPTPPSAQQNGAGGDANGSGAAAAKKRKITDVACSKAKQTPKKKTNRAK